MCFAIGWFNLTTAHVWPDWISLALLGVGAGFGVFCIQRVRKLPDRGPTYWGIWSIAFAPISTFLVCLTKMLSLYSASAWIARLSTFALFFIGLLWAVWFVERRSRVLEDEDDSRREAGKKIWNPFHPRAWYYRRGQEKLDQSFTTFVGYGFVFFVLFMLLTQMSGCKEIYEMPAGAGEEKQKQVVKIKKVVEKKFIINPYSSVIFNPPPIEDIQLEMLEVTEHTYQIGQGAGDGAGFSGGTNRGKVRFIRLEYAGGDWDQDFGVGADLNLLIEYGLRTGHEVAEKTESRQIRQLKNFPATKCPPVVYMTGQKNIIVGERDVEILREYLLDKHGLLFADNGGSGHWHGQFFDMMRRVLPKVRPVRVPLDHPIHQIPYPIPFLPYVAPHGGREAYGWVVDGRLVCYYHPGDIGDAWADGHAGVPRRIWEHCYQLGTNVLFYGHAEYNRWVTTQEEKE